MISGFVIILATLGSVDSATDGADVQEQALTCDATCIRNKKNLVKFGVTPIGARLAYERKLGVNTSLQVSGALTAIFFVAVDSTVTVEFRNYIKPKPARGLMQGIYLAPYIQGASTEMSEADPEPYYSLRPGLGVGYQGELSPRWLFDVGVGAAYEWALGGDLEETIGGGEETTGGGIYVLPRVTLGIACRL